MSMIRDGFRSLYRSGAYFSEGVIPRALERAGVSHARAAKIGAGAGMALGIASLVVGAAYALAIPMALPMCGVAIAVYGAKGLAMAAGLVAVLGGTGGVVMTTALGMCREITHSTSGKLQKAAARLHAPPMPEKTRFRQKLQAKLGFRKAVGNKAPQASLQSKPPIQTPQPG
jgi:hypothetical protein